jgi:hypothetical protein
MTLKRKLIKKIKNNQILLKKRITDVTETKIKWEDTFHFLLVWCTFQGHEREKKREEKTRALPNHREPWYMCQLNDALPLVGVGNTIIWLFVHRRMKHALLECDDPSLHVNTFSSNVWYIFYIIFIFLKRPNNEKTKIKGPKNTLLNFVYKSKQLHYL